jgi:hypothetical protein
VKYDVYGRFVVEVIRRGGEWETYRVDEGKRLRMREVAIPPAMSMDQIPCYLDDLWHESASPGKSIRRLE